VLTAAEGDRVVAEQFLRVAALQDPVTRLFRLPTALRVLLGSLRRRPAPAIDATTRVAAGDHPPDRVGQPGWRTLE
jgi:hypothetical protein